MIRSKQRITGHGLVCADAQASLCHCRSKTLKTRFLSRGKSPVGFDVIISYCKVIMNGLFPRKVIFCQKNMMEKHFIRKT